MGGVQRQLEWSICVHFLIFTRSGGPCCGRSRRLDREPLTSGVEGACDSAAFPCQPVVRRQRGVRLLAQDRHTTCFEQWQRLRRDTKPTLAATAEDHQFRLVVQQLSHVCAENAWPVICAGFAPVPYSA